MCHAAMTMLWATATDALLGPRRAARRRYWAAKEVFFVLAAARAASIRDRPSQRFPFTDAAARRLPLAGRLVGPGRHARPRRELTCCGEHGHIAAGLRDEHLGGGTAPTRDAAQQSDGRLERRDALGDVLAQCVDGRVKERDVPSVVPVDEPRNGVLSETVG